MENQHEVISIHVGQCGVQLGDNLWELYCNERNIDGQLKYVNDYDNDPFFSESKSGKYTPRSLFVDLDDESIDNIRIGRLNYLYSSDQLINYNENASKNYACGRYTTGPHIIERTLEGIRKLANQCNNLDEFMIFHSLGGGTGSGFSSLLFDCLKNEYPKATKFNIAIFPSEVFSSSSYEIYNTVLSAHSIIDHMKICFSFDNKSLYNVSKNFLYVGNPRFKTLNEIVCQVTSSITNPLRHSESNAEKSTLNIFRSYADLFPDYMPNFSVCSYAPLYPILRSCAQFSIDDLTKIVFQPDSALIESNIQKCKYYACGLFYRGDVCLRDINIAIQSIYGRRNFHLIYQSLKCFKIGMNYLCPSNIVDSEMTKYFRSLCLVANTTAISDKWRKINQEFILMYQKRQFIHSYVCEGMEQLEFEEAQDELIKLISKYGEIEESDSETEEEEDL